MEQPQGYGILYASLLLSVFSKEGQDAYMERPGCREGLLGYRESTHRLSLALWEGWGEGTIRGAATFHSFGAPRPAAHRAPVPGGVSGHAALFRAAVPSVRRVVALYISVDLFTTLGLGDWVRQTLNAMWAGGIDALLGFVQSGVSFAVLIYGHQTMKDAS
jgi:hypothetical protein